MCLLGSIPYPANKPDRKLLTPPTTSHRSNRILKPWRCWCKEEGGLLSTHHTKLTGTWGACWEQSCIPNPETVILGWMTWWNAAVMEQGKHTHRGFCCCLFALCAVDLGANRQEVPTFGLGFNHCDGIWFNNETLVMFQTPEQTWCGTGIQGRVAAVSSLTCVNACMEQRCQGLVSLKLKMRQTLISGKAGLSPEEAVLSLWGLSERFPNMSMPVSFSVLEFNFWSVITPVHPCNFIAFFITDIIYNNPAVILASAIVSAVSVSPSKMMKVKLDYIIHARFSFFLCFHFPKCWLIWWSSSGLFFPSIRPQRYTASSWPFLGAEGLKKHP